MEIQQHDGVVVEATVISAGLRQALGDGGVSQEGEGEARGLGAQPSLPPTIYRVPRGGAGPRRSNLLGGRQPRGCLAPQGKGGAPTPRVSTMEESMWWKAPLGALGGRETSPWPPPPLEMGSQGAGAPWTPI